MDIVPLWHQSLSTASWDSVHTTHSVCTYLTFKVNSELAQGWLALYPSIAVMFSGPAQDALVKRKLGIQPTFALGGLLLGGGGIGSSYAKNYGVFLFCSVLTAIGLGFTAWASPGVTSLWFVRRRGVAVSLALMGSGLGTFAYVMATNKLLVESQTEEGRLVIRPRSWNANVSFLKGPPDHYLSFCHTLFPGYLRHYIPCSLGPLGPDNLDQAEHATATPLRSHLVYMKLHKQK